MMKSLLAGIGLVAVVLVVFSAQAALVTYDGFNYTPTGPASINDQSGGYGWDANWGQFLGNALSYIVTNGSLSDPTMTLFTSSNRVYTAGGFAGRFFSEPFPDLYGTPGTTNYFSILIRPESTPATNHYYGLQLFSDATDTGSGHDVFVGKTGASLFYGLEYSTNDVTGGTNVFIHTFSGTQATLNQTVFLVVRVAFANPSGADTISLYVNPTPGGAEPGTPAATLSVDLGAANGLALNSGNGAQVSFDEIRFGATFDSVTSTGEFPADLLTYEPFAYEQTNVTATLDGQPNNGTQNSNGWDNVTWGQFLGGATSYLIGHGSLADPSGKLVTSGNDTYTTTGFAGRYNVYTGLPGHTNANPTYYSVLIRPDNLGATNGISYLQIFGQPNGNDLLAGKLSGSTFWGLQSGTNLGQAFSTVQAVSNQTTLLVVRGNYVQGGASTFRLYVNPTPGEPEPVTADATVSFNIQTQNGLAFNTQNGAAASFDEIRVGTSYADVTPAVTVVTNPFNITSIARVGNDIVLTWNTTGGNTNVVQATNGSNGNYSTNNFANVSSQMIISGSGSVTTNYVDLFGATNAPARYYRVRRVP